MAKAVGFSCDLEGCGRFETSISDVTLPDGWITVVPHATVPRARPDRDGEKVEKREPAPLHLCSNKCLAELGLKRYEAETGKRLVRQKKGSDR